jgi:hypothetical protein
VIIGKNLEDIKTLKKMLADSYPIKDMGELKMILGMQVIRDRKKRTLDITQAHYIRDLLTAYRMENCKPVATPVDGYESLLPAKAGELRADQQLYQQAIGSDLFLSGNTRPDISFAVNKLSQYCSDPTVRHWNGILRIFRYLSGTEDYSLHFGPGTDGRVENLLGYADADYASSLDRISTSAYVFTFGGAAISWSSKKQRTVATSTVEAEYIALCSAAKHGVWLRNLFSELGQAKFLGGDPPDRYTAQAVHILGDNQGGLALANNPENHARTKHIDVQYHYTRHLLATGALTISYCPTENMLADILTKPLPKVRILRLLEGLFGQRSKEPMRH